MSLPTRITPSRAANMVLQVLGHTLNTIVLDKHCEAFIVIVYGHQKLSFSVFTFNPKIEKIIRFHWVGNIF